MEETWTTVRNIFTVEGPVSSAIYRDILNIEAVGITGRWDDNYREAVLLKAKRMLVVRLAIRQGWHRISLSSQILVVFTVFGGALGVGVLLFLVEIVVRPKSREGRIEEERFKGIF